MRLSVGEWSETVSRRVERVVRLIGWGLLIEIYRRLGWWVAKQIKGSPWIDEAESEKLDFTLPVIDREGCEANLQPVWMGDLEPDMGSARI